MTQPIRFGGLIILIKSVNGCLVFDKKNIFNMFRDYPHNLTPKQKEIFDEENPEWADFFKDRV